MSDDEREARIRASQAGVVQPDETILWLLARLDAERELIARIYHLCELPDLSDREVRSAIRDMCGAVLAASGTATGGDGDG